MWLVGRPSRELDIELKKRSRAYPYWFVPPVGSSMGDPGAGDGMTIRVNVDHDVVSRFYADIDLTEWPAVRAQLQTQFGKPVEQGRTFTWHTTPPIGTTSASPSRGHVELASAHPRSPPHRRWLKD
jgi:hypothetical protein